VVVILPKPQRHYSGRRRVVSGLLRLKIKNQWGCVGRVLNFIDPVGSSSVSSAGVAQIELRILGIHSSSFPPGPFVASPVCSRVCFHVDDVLVFCPLVIFIPGNLATWDESVWNRSRDGFMDATRWRVCRRSCQYVGRISSRSRMLFWKFYAFDSAGDLDQTWIGYICCEMMLGLENIYLLIRARCTVSYIAAHLYSSFHRTHFQNT
jgi:hypothetical protein